MLALGLFLSAIAHFAHRNRIIFNLQFRNGQLAKAHGRIPLRLMQELAEICARHRASRLIVICSKLRGHLQVNVTGDDNAELEQQVRNLIGIWPLARLVTAPRIRHKPQPIT